MNIEREDYEVYGYMSIEEAIDVVSRYVCERYGKCPHGVRRIDCVHCDRAADMENDAREERAR